MSFAKTIILLVITGVFTIIFVAMPIYKVTNEITATKQELIVIKANLNALNTRLNKSTLLKM